MNSRIKEFAAVLLNRERQVFFVLLLLNLIPVLTVKYFTTNDGGPHIYNANILQHLVTSPRSIIHSFYQINHELIPNWIGHALLVLLKVVMPGWLADKCLQLIYLVFLPISFRWYILCHDKQTNPLIWMVFPLCYSFSFYSGFYNFSLALILMFCLLSLWHHAEQESSIKFAKILLVLFLLTALYFSHVFVFGFTLMVMCIDTLINKTGPLIRGAHSFVYAAKKLFFRGLTLLVIALPGLILSLFYFSNRADGMPKYLTLSELFSWIVDIRPLIFYGFTHESNGIVYLIAALIIISLITAWKLFISLKKGQWNRILSHPGLVLLLGAILSLALYFNLPDEDGYAGFISVRLLTLFFLLGVGFLSMIRLRDWQTLILAITVLVGQGVLLQMHSCDQLKFNDKVKHISEASSFISANKIVLPVNWSNNWIENHYLHYVAADKAMVLLDNYEADTRYFPVLWNESGIPKVMLGSSISGVNCLNWKSNNQSGDYLLIDYVLEFNANSLSPQDECRKVFLLELQKNYKPLLVNDDITLYGLK